MTTPEAPKTAVFVCSHHSGHINPILASLVPLFQSLHYEIHFFTAASRQATIENLEGNVIFHDDSVSKLSMQQANQKATQDLFGLELQGRGAHEFLPE